MSSERPGRTTDDDIRRAPAHCFRVVGYDQFDYADYLVGDFPTKQEAAVALRQHASRANGLPTSCSDIFFIYDDRGACIAQLTYDDLPKDDRPEQCGGSG